jgi:hypothetical protein
MKLRVGLVLTLVAAAAVRTGAQATSPGAQAPATQPAPKPMQIVGVEATRVLLDVVVRDGKDNPVTDLQATDFEVFEDGVRQQVDLFEVTGSPTPVAAAPQPAVAAPAPATATPAPPRRQEVALIAFVFDRLSPEARPGQDSSPHLPRRGPSADDRVGVFLIDLSLVTLRATPMTPSSSGRPSSGAASGRPPPTRRAAAGNAT